MSMCVNVQPFLNECIGTAQTIFMKYCSNTIAYEKNILHKYLQKIQHSRIVTMVNQSINLQLLQVNTSNESIPWKKKQKLPKNFEKAERLHPGITVWVATTANFPRKSIELTSLMPKGKVFLTTSLALKRLESKGAQCGQPGQRFSSWSPFSSVRNWDRSDLSASIRWECTPTRPGHDAPKMPWLNVLGQEMAELHL